MKIEPVALAASLLWMAALLQGCGLANSLGAPHPFYSDDARFCQHCVRSQRMCVDTRRGGTCEPLEALADCAAAEHFVFDQQQVEGPYLGLLAGRTESVRKVFSSCVDGEGADGLRIDAILFDPGDQHSLDVDFDVLEELTDRSVDVELVFESGERFHPVAWSSYPQTGANEQILYTVDLLFCLPSYPEWDSTLALRVKDLRDNYSNIVCLDPIN